ncbi:hypothetical protein HDU67_003177 [Dinochytrium kinnereticum]|nr:hypothetical protein HDU67_003177 [Dinochytrium kinnereticum]
MVTYTHSQDSIWCLYSNHPDLETFWSGGRDGWVTKMTRRRIGGDASMKVGRGAVHDELVDCVAICREEGGVNKIVAIDDQYVWTATNKSSINRWRDIPFRHATVVSSTDQITDDTDAIILPSSSIIRQPKPLLDDERSLRSYHFSVTSQDASSSMAPILSTKGPGGASVEEWEVEEGGAVEPVWEHPDEVVRGGPSIARYTLLANRRWVVTEDTEGKVEVWDIVRCGRVRECGSEVGGCGEGKSLYERVVEMETTFEWIANWCTLDNKNGYLTVHLDESKCYDAEMYHEDSGCEYKPAMEDQRINIGRWVLTNLFLCYLHATAQRVPAAALLHRDFYLGALTYTDRGAPPEESLIYLYGQEVNYGTPPPPVVDSHQAEDQDDNTALGLTDWKNSPTRNGDAATTLALDLARNTTVNEDDDGGVKDRGRRAEARRRDTPNSMDTSGSSASTSSESSSIPSFPPLAPPESSLPKPSLTIPPPPSTPPPVSARHHSRSISLNVVLGSGEALRGQEPAMPPHPPFGVGEGKRRKSLDSAMRVLEKGKMMFGGRRRSKSREGVLAVAGERGGEKEGKPVEQVGGDTAAPVVAVDVDVGGRGVEAMESALEVVKDLIANPIDFSPSPEDIPPIRLPPSVPIILSIEESSDVGAFLDQFRSTVGGLGWVREALRLDEHIPKWVYDGIIDSKTLLKDPSKMSFILLPHPTSNLPDLPNNTNRLSSNRMLRIRKLLSYVVENVSIDPPPDLVRAAIAEMEADPAAAEEGSAVASTLAVLKFWGVEKASAGEKAAAEKAARGLVRPERFLELCCCDKKGLQYDTLTVQIGVGVGSATEEL